MQLHLAPCLYDLWVQPHPAGVWPSLTRLLPDVKAKPVSSVSISLSLAEQRDRALTAKTPQCSASWSRATRSGLS